MMSAKPKRTSLRDQAKALFRDAILQAAEDVFAERGFHTARIQDIAERAGIGVGTVYNHFDQKDDVLTALLIERGDAMKLEFATRADDPKDWEARLRARLGRLFGYAEQHRNYFRVACDLGLFGPGHPGLPVELRQERRARFLNELKLLIEEGIESGSLARGDVARLSRFFSGAVRGVLEGAMMDRITDLQGEVSQLVDLFMRAAGASHSKGAR
jgi:AcrR family transcriptional regulator